MFVIALTIIVLIVGFRFCYRTGYVNGSRYIVLLLSGFKENSIYQVLAFSQGDGSDEHQMMFLKNTDPDAEFPIAAVNRAHLIYEFAVGEYVKTDDNKAITKSVWC